VVRQIIFKLTIGNESLHQDNKDNGVRIRNIATSKILLFKSMKFLHQNTHKYNWTSPDGKTHIQIDHILTDRLWQSSILDVGSLRGADCVNDHYLDVAKFRESLAINIQAAQKFYGERFNLRKLNDLEVRKQYQTEISNRFAASENLSDSEDLNRAWENINLLNAELNLICHLLVLLGDLTFMGRCIVSIF
jgi:hypothetical protein